MEFSDIHPMAAVFGVAGLLIGFIMLQVMGAMDEEIQLALIWRILTPIVCGAGSFFLAQKMFE